MCRLTMSFVSWQTAVPAALRLATITPRYYCLLRCLGRLSANAGRVHRRSIEIREEFFRATLVHFPGCDSPHHRLLSGKARETSGREGGSRYRRGPRSTFTAGGFPGFA